MTIFGKPLQDLFIADCFRDPEKLEYSTEAVARIKNANGSVLSCLTGSVTYYGDMLSAIAAFISFCYIIYAGYLMFTAFGDEAKYTQGKKTLLYAIVGFVISIMAVVIIQLFKSVLLPPLP